MSGLQNKKIVKEMHLIPDQSMQGSHNSQFCGKWFVGLRKTQVENITMAKNELWKEKFIFGSWLGKQNKQDMGCHPWIFLRDSSS